MTLPSLINGLEKPEFKNVVIQQLNKDFQKVGLNIEFSINTQAKNLSKLLTNTIEEILNSNQSDKVQQLLYCVDVPEEWIKNQLEENLEMNCSTIISYSILMREVQKVFYRDSF